MLVLNELIIQLFHDISLKIINFFFIKKVDPFSLGERNLAKKLRLFFDDSIDIRLSKYELTLQ